MHCVMVIDDDPLFLESLKNIVGYRSEYNVDVFRNPAEALEVFPEKTFTCVFLNLGISRMNGLAIMKSLQQTDPYVPVIVVVEASYMSIALEALKQGAYDFIEKPMDINRLFIILRHAVEKRIWTEERHNLHRLLNDQTEIIFESRNMQEVMHRIRHLAQTGSHLLLSGEPGTGKRMIARYLHNQSPRRSRAFISVNCASMENTILEKKIFGDGNGEIRNSEGCNTQYSRVHGKTLFLEEVGHMHPDLQQRVLGLCQKASPGHTDELPPSAEPDVRIIASTSSNLSALVENRVFLKELYHKLNGVHISIPALRDRREDIILLAQNFLRKYATDFNKRLDGFSEQASEALLQYHWPGNVMELKNVIEMIAFFTRNNPVECEDIHQALDVQDQLNRFEVSPGSLKEETQHQERKHIIKVLEMNDWRILKTAAMLGINRTSLYKKMKKYAIQRNSLN